MKENDWLLNSISNPTFTITDFKNVGLDISNTSFANEETYKKLPEIQQMPQFQTDGKFDEQKFHKNYLAAAYSFNNFTNSSYEEDVLKNIEYHRDNIFFDSKQRGDKPEVVFTKSPNPLRDYSNTIQLGKVTENKFSAREIAQKEKTLLNPVEYEKGADPIWGDSPNDSFFDLNTRVLAQWDNDGEHIDLTTGEKVAHKKGDFKINENGSIFYENLDGRNIYNKDVLSRLDTITEDGSTLNKYDFFDSDDKEKSVFGSVMKVAATMAPLLTPIAPYYLGIGIGLQTAKLGATLGKIFAGSDSEVLSNIEGFVKSMQPSVSDYSTQKMWTVENLLNLVGDVFLQLGQQRWLFEYAPAAFTGGKVINNSAASNALQKKFLEDTSILNQEKVFKYLQTNGLKGIKELETAKQLTANAKLKDFMEKYNNIGKYISRAYMTGITTADAYGEAKREGASDIEAAFLTLGYTFAEYGLMSTALGERILPELRQEKIVWKDLQKKLLNLKDLKQPAGNELSDKVTKYKWLKDLFNIGYDAATAAKSTAPKIASTVFANALGEGIEETTEELLFDLSKSVFNGIRYLNGNDERLTYWDNIFDRYSMSFLGGMIGGGLTELRPSIRNLRNVNTNLTSQQAYQELVDIVRNKKDEEFLKILDKNVLGNKELTTEVIQEGDTYIYKPVTDKNDISQDQAAKNQIKFIIKNIKDTLNSEGAAISDEILIDLLTGVRKDLKHIALRNLSTASIYLQDFNNIMTDLSACMAEYKELNSTAGRQINDVKDGDDKANEEHSQKLNSLNNRIKELREKKEAFFNGDKQKEFIQLSTFEMSQAVREAYQGAADFKTFVEFETKKKFNEVDETTLNNLKTQWESYKQGKFKDDLQLAFNVHQDIAIKFNKFLENQLNYFKNPLSNSKIETINRFENYINTKFYTGAESILNAPNSALILQRAQNQVDSNGLLYDAIDLIKNVGSKEINDYLDVILTNKIGLDEDGKRKVIDDYDTQYEVYNALVQISEDLLNLYKEQGFINPIIRDKLSRFLSEASELEIPNAIQILSDLEDVNVLANSDMITLLDQFDSTLSTNLNISKVLESISQAFYKSNGIIENFNLSPDVVESLPKILKLIDLLGAQILSARTDRADFDNIFGLNKTINELNPDIKLTELDSKEADTMIYDLEKIKNHLNTTYKILKALLGQKIVEQETTSAKIQLLTFKRLKNFQLPDTWDKSNFEEAISKMEKTNSLLSKIDTKLTEDERRNINEEFSLLENALYDLYQKNSDKFSEEEIKTFMSNFNLLVDKQTTLNQTFNNLDDVDLFWYMVTRMAVKSSDFYHTYSKIISNKIAPFLSQQMAVYTAFASIVNKPLFIKFSKIFNDKVANQIESLSDSELNKRQLSKEYSYSSNYAVRFPYITFIEGLAGTGKTNAVFVTVAAMLSVDNPQLLENVWIVHATEDGAKDLGEVLKNSTNIQNIETMSHDQYMKKIANDWSEEFDDNGNLIAKDIKRNDKFIYESSLNLNTTTKPSLILIDEFSRHSFLDDDLTDKFSKLMGVPVVAAGNFDQTKVQGTYEEKLDNLVVTTNLLPKFNNFITSYKLGILIRPANEPLFKSIINIYEHLDTLKETPGALSNQVFTNYTEIEEGENKGLYGIKTINGNDKLDEISFRNTLNLLKSTLKEKNGKLQKIGFIYNDEESKAYKIIMSDYSDIIQPFKGMSAQGFESQYYIIDDWDIKNKNMYNWDAYYTNMYTAITRTSQGAIWIKNSIEPAQIASYRINTTDPSITSFDSETISNYSNKIKNELQNKYTEESEIKFKPFGELKTSEKNEPNKKQEESVDKGTGLNSDDFNKEESLDEAMKNLRKKQKELNSQVANTTSRIFENNGFNLLHYSDYAQETGAILNSKNEFELPENTKFRIDNLNGLSKLRNNDLKDLNAYLKSLRQFILNYKGDLKQLGNELNLMLRTNLSNPYAQFIIKKYSKNNHTNPKFDRNPEEKLDGLLSDTEYGDKLLNANISLVFGDETKGDLLEISLVSLPNFKTVLSAEAFEDIVKYFNIDVKNLNFGSQLTLLGAFRDFIKNNPDSLLLDKVKMLHSFLNLYTLLEDSVININKLKDLEDWTIGNNSETFGPRVLNKDLGENYNNSNFISKKGITYTLNDLKDPDKSGLFISDIYISLVDTIKNNKGESIKISDKGMPFVLVSEEKINNIENAYIEDLRTQGHSNRISLVCVNPPTAPLEDYLINLKNILNKSNDDIKNIGNTFTAYRMLATIIDNPNLKIPISVDKNAVKKYVEIIKNSTDFKNAIEKLKQSLEKEDLKFGGKSISIKNYFQAVLYNLMFDENGNFITENKDLLEQVLKNNNWNGIFYNITFDRNVKQNSEFVKIKTDPNSYTIDKYNFTLVGKITKPSYLIDMKSIYQQITDENILTLHKENGKTVKYSKHTKSYIEGKTFEGSSEKSSNKAKFINTFGNNSAQVQSILRNAKKDQDVDYYIEYLKKLNYIYFNNVDGNPRLLNIGEDLKNSTIEIIPDLENQGQQSQYNIKITKNSNEYNYKVTFNTDSNGAITAKVEQIIENVQPTEKKSIETILDDVQKSDLLENFLMQNETFQKFTAEQVENFINGIANSCMVSEFTFIPNNSSFIGMLNELENFDKKDIQDFLNITNFLDIFNTVYENADAETINLAKDFVSELSKILFNSTDQNQKVEDAENQPVIECKLINNINLI